MGHKGKFKERRKIRCSMLKSNPVPGQVSFSLPCVMSVWCPIASVPKYQDICMELRRLGEYFWFVLTFLQVISCMCANNELPFLEQILLKSKSCTIIFFSIKPEYSIYSGLEDHSGLFLGPKVSEAAVWFVPPGVMVSTQEQLACSAHARPAEGALTRRPQEQLACSSHARPAEGALTRHPQEQLACSAHARPAEGALTRRPQEQLACSSHARPAEGALTRPTVQRPGRCLRLLSPYHAVGKRPLSCRLDFRL